MWKRCLFEDLQNTKAGVFAYCKGTAPVKCALLRRQDGTLTGNAGEVHELVRDAWLPIFQMYHVDAEPSWEDFVQRFGAYFPPLCQMEEKPLN